LRQLYLLVFWPTQYLREVEEESGQRRMTSGERFHYLMRMFPWVLGLSIVLNLTDGNLCEALGLHFYSTTEDEARITHLHTRN